MVYFIHSFDFNTIGPMNRRELLRRVLFSTEQQTTHGRRGKEHEYHSRESWWCACPSPVYIESWSSLAEGSSVSWLRIKIPPYWRRPYTILCCCLESSSTFGGGDPIPYSNCQSIGPSPLRTCADPVTFCSATALCYQLNYSLTSSLLKLHIYSIPYAMHWPQWQIA